MKRTLCLLLSALLLLACVPTPEVDAVRQKDTNQLIEAVRNQTEARADAEATAKPLQLPERMQWEAVTETQHVTVRVDAPVTVFADGAFPLARVERAALTDAQRLQFAKRVLNSETVYRYVEQPKTREELAKRIAELMEEPSPKDKAQWLAEDVENTEQAWQALLAEREALAKELQEQYRSLPEDAKIIPHAEWDGTWTGESWMAVVKDPYATQLNSETPFLTVSEDSIRYDGPTGSSAGTFDWPIKPGVYRIAPDAMDTPQGDASITPTEAGNIALSLFDGLCDLSVNAILWSNDAPTDGDTRGKVNRWAYLVRLTPVVNGAALLYDRYGASPASGESGVNADAYVPYWSYDHAIVAIDGDGNLLAAELVTSDRLTELLAEQTELLPIEEIETLLMQRLNYVFAAWEYQNDTIVIDRIELGLFRIREKNRMDTGLLVPVWRFSGQLHSGTYPNQGYSENLAVLNAIDGNGIDPNMGY